MEEMMKILSENKRKIQEKKKQIRIARNNAKDILGVICMSLIFIFIMILIANIPDRHDVNRDGVVSPKDMLEIRNELEG